MYLVILIKDDDSLKDRQEVSVYYNRAFSQIEQEIRKFAGFQTIVHSNNSNVISLTINWERENLRSLVNQILRIREVDGLLTFPNYIEELKDAMEMHDFFKVVSYSSTLLESYGKQILIKHFEEKNKEIDHERILGFNFNATANILYYAEIIDKELFKNINDVKKERNIIHEMSNPDLIKPLSKKRVKELEDIANKAIHSVSELMAKIDR